MKEIGIDSGSVEVGHNAQIGYFAKTSFLLDENATIFETIDNIAVGEVRTQLKTSLEHLCFTEMILLKK